MALLHNYSDPLYGTWLLPASVAQLVACPTFQRLRGVNQSGASKYADPLRTITRFEHSMGVYLLLRCLGAAEEEQVAGLLHDISHTAFSHVVDIVYYSREQAFHEDLKAGFLDRPDLRAALGNLGFKVQDLLSDESYPLLEQPLPALCADRIDYSLRDAVTMGEISIPAARTILGDLVIHDDRLAMRTPALACQFAGLFREMNDTYWAAQKENFLYEMLARAIEIGLKSRVLDRSDLLADDDTVEAKLRAAGDLRIEALFGKLVDPPAAEIAAFVPSRPIKQRAIDPLVLLDGTAVAISQLGNG